MYKGQINLNTILAAGWIVAAVLLFIVLSKPSIKCPECPDCICPECPEPCQPCPECPQCPVPNTTCPSQECKCECSCPPLPSERLTDFTFSILLAICSGMVGLAGASKEKWLHALVAFSSIALLCGFLYFSGYSDLAFICMFVATFILVAIMTSW